VPDGVGAGRDRLCLERLDRPVLWHLARDDAEQVVLQADDVDELDTTADARGPEIAAEVLAAVRQIRVLRRTQRQGPGERDARPVLPDRKLQVGADRHLAGGNGVSLSCTVEDGDHVRDRRRGEPVSDEHSDAVEQRRRR
jgi:hypothetical protein